MKLATDELDRRILKVLEGGEQVLSDLAVNTGCDARDILKRLHVLAGGKLVKCSKHSGSLFWSLGSTSPPEPMDDCAKATRLPDPPRVDDQPLKPSSPTRKRRNNQSIVVREAVYVPELRVLRLGPDQVLIEEVHREDLNRENDGVAVNTTDLPGLIAALTAIHEEAAA